MHGQWVALQAQSKKILKMACHPMHGITLLHQLSASRPTSHFRNAFHCCFTLKCVLATGLIAGKASAEEQTLEMTLQLLPSNPLAEAACEAAGALQTLELPLHVQPSTAPASVTFLLGDQELPVVVSFMPS